MDDRRDRTSKEKQSRGSRETNVSVIKDDDNKNGWGDALQLPTGRILDTKKNAEGKRLEKINRRRQTTEKKEYKSRSVDGSKG
jgi:hypothetical protein